MHHCTVFGWVPSTAISGRPAVPLTLVKAAEEALDNSAGATANALWEQAATLLPESAPIHEGLADAYTLAADPRSAAATQEASALRAKAPLRAWSPDDPDLKITPICQGQPCALAWGPAIAADVIGAAGGIKLGVGPRCAGTGPKPDALILALPGPATGRGVQVRRRVIGGGTYSNDFQFTRLGRWETLALAAYEEPMTLLIDDVMADAENGVVLQIDTSAPDGSRAYVVQLLWPPGC